MAETFVLVHGSWHGGWAWEPTAWCLRELGHTVYAPTYPGHQPGASRAGITHADYVKAVTEMFAKAAAQSPDNTVACDWEVFRDQFMQDARPQDARSVWERL